MTQYTRSEFFEKMDWEGGVDGMYYYAGDNVEITDDPILELAWKSVCQNLEIVYSQYDKYEEEADAEMFEE